MFRKLKNRVEDLFAVAQIVGVVVAMIFLLSVVYFQLTTEKQIDDIKHRWYKWRLAQMDCNIHEAWDMYEHFSLRMNDEDSAEEWFREARDREREREEYAQTCGLPTSVLIPKT